MNNPSWLWDFLPEPIRAGIMAAVIAVLRVMYDSDEPRWVRVLLEAALCGSIAVGVAHLTQALGMSQGWATFLGAAVGLFGAEEVRSFGRRVANERVR
jgi:lambda family phage holin